MFWPLCLQCSLRTRVVKEKDAGGWVSEQSDKWDFFSMNCRGNFIAVKEFRWEFFLIWSAMSRHLLEIRKHIGGLNEENISICCCFVPEGRMGCAVHALGREWVQFLAGRALQHPESSSSIPAAAAPFSRLCWPLLVLLRGATFPTLPHFPASRTTLTQRFFSVANPSRFFWNVCSAARRSDGGIFCRWHPLRCRGTASDPAPLHCSAPQSCTKSKLPALPFPKSHHPSCDTPSQGSRAWALLWARPSLLTLASIPIQNTQIYPYF